IFQGAFEFPEQFRRSRYAFFKILSKRHELQECRCSIKSFYGKERPRALLPYSKDLMESKVWISRRFLKREAANWRVGEREAKPAAGYALSAPHFLSFAFSSISNRRFALFSAV